MAEAIRNLQLFRNGTISVTTAANVKAATEAALNAPAPDTLVLNDGEPIIVRYKETQDGPVKGIYGVAYINGDVKTILWTSGEVSVVADLEQDDYVAINITENPDGTFNVSATTNVVAIDDATEQNDGLVTAYDVKQHLSGIDSYNEGHDVNFRTEQGASGQYIDVALDSPIETSVTVGNLPSGSTIPANASLSDILELILVKEYQAVSNNPKTTISVSTLASSYSVGDMLPELTIGHTYTDGQFTPPSGYPLSKWTLYNGTNPLPAQCAEGNTTYKFDNATITLVDGKYTHPTALTEGKHIFKCSTGYGASTVVPKTNLGNDSTTSISAGTAQSSNVEFNVYYNFYTQMVATLPADYSSVFTSGTKNVLTSNSAYSSVMYNIEGGKKMILLVPTSRTFTIKNALGMDATSEFNPPVATVTDANGVVYSVHIKINDADSTATYTNLIFANA